MTQILDYVDDDDLERLIRKYIRKHEELEEESSSIIKEAGREIKEPGILSNAFIWFTTEIKLMLKDDDHGICKILMNGCNMGIQSISEKINACCQTDREVRKHAEKLVSMEETFMQELKTYV